MSGSPHGTPTFGGRSSAEKDEGFKKVAVSV